MGAHAAADTAIVSLSRARVCQGSKIWNSHPNSQKIEANPPRFLPSRDLYCKKLEYELGYLRNLYWSLWIYPKRVQPGPD